MKENEKQPPTQEIPSDGEVEEEPADLELNKPKAKEGETSLKDSH